MHAYMRRHGRCIACSLLSLWALTSIRAGVVGGKTKGGGGEPEGREDLANHDNAGGCKAEPTMIERWTPPKCMHASVHDHRVHHCMHGGSMVPSHHGPSDPFRSSRASYRPRTRCPLPATDLPVSDAPCSRGPALLRSFPQKCCCLTF